MSVRPAGGSSSDQPGHGPTPEERRRAKLLVRVVLSAAAVLVLAAWAVTRSSGQGSGTLPAGSTQTTEIGATIPAETILTSVTTIAAPPTTSIAMPPVEVEFQLGAAIIAGHIICHREDDLIGDSVEAVRAAVAADNDVASDRGGAPKPYADDAAAQSEIVRASVQVLHDMKRFYADCERVSGSATGRAVFEDSSPSATRTLPPSR